jgi:hypothetical protein
VRQAAHRQAIRDARTELAGAGRQIPGDPTIVMELMAGDDEEAA